MSLVEHLRRDYGDFLIDIPHWEIADEGITALWGPSGAGKTSLFRVLLGLEACPGMKWTFKGEELSALKTPDRRLGVVFQSLELFPHMTAKKNILFAAQARKVKESDKRLNELVEQLELQSFLHRSVELLSGGERQRVALARALIGEPRFLFLDEPFSALDAHLKAGARQLVQSVIEARKIPTLLVSHDSEDLETLAHTVVKIEKGRLVT